MCIEIRTAAFRVEQSCPHPGGMMLLRCGAAFDQVAHAAEKLGIVNDVEQSTAAVLTALAIWSRERPLLVHVAENCIGVTAS